MKLRSGGRSSYANHRGRGSQPSEAIPTKTLESFAKWGKFKNNSKINRATLTCIWETAGKILWPLGDWNPHPPCSQHCVSSPGPDLPGVHGWLWHRLHSIVLCTIGIKYKLAHFSSTRIPRTSRDDSAAFSRSELVFFIIWWVFISASPLPRLVLETEEANPLGVCYLIVNAQHKVMLLVFHVRLSLLVNTGPRVHFVSVLHDSSVQSGVLGGMRCISQAWNQTLRTSVMRILELTLFLSDLMISGSQYCNVC